MLFHMRGPLSDACLSWRKFQAYPSGVPAAIGMLSPGGQPTQTPEEPHLATSKIYPIQFHGDPYFDLMDLWFDENLTLGHMMVRSEQAIKDSIASSVLDNPIFAELKDDNRFFEISHKLSQLRKEVKNDSQHIKETSR
ncbi:hypothetical protein, partial [Collinsella tanakaei]|uniref:hypothetical protein n=1 Tax=Collinsella tanakaei TaxID=626935 RepID=UPI002F94742F